MRVSESGRCGAHCSFSYAVGFYSKTAANATANVVTGDATGTLGTLPLAGSGLGAAGWIDRLGDSLGYQTAPFAPSRGAFRPTMIATTAQIAAADSTGNSGSRRVTDAPSQWRRRDNAPACRWC